MKRKTIKPSTIFRVPEVFNKIQYGQCAELRQYFKARGITDIESKVRAGFTLVRAARNFVKDDQSYFFSVLTRMIILLYPEKYCHQEHNTVLNQFLCQ